MNNIIKNNIHLKREDHERKQSDHQRQQPSGGRQKNVCISSVRLVVHLSHFKLDSDNKFLKWLPSSYILCSFGWSERYCVRIIAFCSLLTEIWYYNLIHTWGFTWKFPDSLRCESVWSVHSAWSTSSRSQAWACTQRFQLEKWGEEGGVCW